MADEPEIEGVPEENSGVEGEGKGLPSLSLGSGRQPLGGMPHKKAKLEDGGSQVDEVRQDPGPDEDTSGGDGSETPEGDGTGNPATDDGQIDDPGHDPYHHDDYHDHDYEDYHHDHDHDDYHHNDPEDNWWEEDEKDEDDELPPEGEMSLLDHLEELRWTLFKSVGALVVGCVLVGMNVQYFAEALKKPIQYAVDSAAGRVLKIQDDNRLHAYNLNNGKEAWVYPAQDAGVAVRAQPIVGDKKTKSLFTVAGNAVVALHKQSGKELWRFEEPGRELKSPVLKQGGAESLFLFSTGGLSDTGGSVMAISAKNGKKLKEITTGPGSIPPVFDINREDIELRTRQPLGVMMVLMQVVFFGGLAISLPFIVLFTSGFVAPGLTKREKRMLLPGSIGAVILFLMGAALSYYFIVPVSLKFSAVLNDWLGIELMWDVNDYYSLVVMVTLSVGALFQFPLLLVILGYLGVITAKMLRSARQVVFVIILLIAALLTPGDVIVALVLLTVPLYGLFEGSILMVAYVERAKAKKEARIEARRKKREEARKQAQLEAAEILKEKKAVDPGKPEGTEGGSK